MKAKVIRQLKSFSRWFWASKKLVFLITLKSVEPSKVNTMHILDWFNKEIQKKIAHLIKQKFYFTVTISPLFEHTQLPVRIP